MSAQRTLAVRPGIACATSLHRHEAPLAPLSWATLSLSVWSSHDVHVRRVLLVTSSTLSSPDAGGSAGGESSPDIVERRSGDAGKLHRERGR